MAGLNVDIQETAAGPIARLTGRLDGTGVDRLQLHLNRFVASRHACVTFDLNELSFVSSLGLGALVSFQHQMSRHRGRVVLWGVQRDVRAAITLSGLDKLFEIREGGAASASSQSAPTPSATHNGATPPVTQAGFTGAAQSATAFEVRIGGAAHAPIVRLAGELHPGDVDRLQLHLNTLIAQRPRKVVFDLTALRFVSSMGIGAIVTFQHMIRRNSGEVVLAGLQPNIREMLHVARLDQVLTIRDNVADA